MLDDDTGRSAAEMAVRRELSGCGPFRGPHLRTRQTQVSLRVTDVVLHQRINRISPRDGVERRNQNTGVSNNLWQRTTARDHNRAAPLHRFNDRLTKTLV